jgi:hypothetical protein
VVTSDRYRTLAWLVLGLVALLSLGAVAARNPTLSRLPLPRAGEPWAGGAPQFDPPSGQYDRSVLVELHPSHPQGEVLFTTDGSVPTATVGIRYRQPVILDADYPALTVFRAVEVMNGVVGEVGHAAYLVGVENDLPVVALTVEPADLWDAERGILTRPWARGRDWERAAHVAYLDAGGELGFEAGMGLRTHRMAPFDAAKPSLRLYARQDYGPARLTYPLFPTASGAAPAEGEVPGIDRLLLQAGNQTQVWPLLQDQLIADAVAALDLRAAPRRFVWLFINGESWGIYHLSERIDRFFLEKAYGIDRVDVVQDGRRREGTDADWDALLDWVAASDLSDPAQYATLKSQIDLASFTDFAVLQLYFGTTGEAWFAAHPRGGRWFWLYGGETPSFAPRIDAPLHRSWEAPTDFARLLRALLANPEYRRYLTDRAAMHLDGALAPESLAPRVDAWTELLSPAIGYETARWPRPISWEAEVAFLRRFVRQRGAEVRDQLEARFP